MVTNNEVDKAELYADLCDIICRFDFNIPDDDPFKHTSISARRVANKIVDVLVKHGLVNEL